MILRLRTGVRVFKGVWVEFMELGWDSVMIRLATGSSKCIDLVLVLEVGFKRVKDRVRRIRWV